MSESQPVPRKMLPRDTALTTVDMERTCAICLDQVRGPYQIDCGHQFCTLCLLELQEARQANPATPGLPCPVCRQPIAEIPPSPIYVFPLTVPGTTRTTHLSDCELQRFAEHLRTNFHKVGIDQARLSRYSLYHNVPTGTIISGYLHHKTNQGLILTKGVCFNRWSGEVYPTHPRTREWRWDDTNIRLYQAC